MVLPASMEFHGLEWDGRMGVDTISECGCGEEHGNGNSDSTNFHLPPKPLQRPHIHHTMKSIEELHSTNRFTLLALWTHFSSLSYQPLPIVPSSDTANVRAASEDNLTAVTRSTLTQMGTLNLPSHTEYCGHPTRLMERINRRSTV